MFPITIHEYSLSFFSHARVKKSCPVKPLQLKSLTSSSFTFFLWQDCQSGSESHSVMSNCLRPHGLYSPWNSLGQNTGVGHLFLLQRVFPIQGLNPGLLYCRWIFYQLSHKGSPRILEWVAFPFSRDLPYPGIKPGSPPLQAGSLPVELPGNPLTILPVCTQYFIMFSFFHSVYHSPAYNLIHFFFIVCPMWFPSEIKAWQ